MEVKHIAGTENPADMLTKHLYPMQSCSIAVTFFLSSEITSRGGVDCMPLVPLYIYHEFSSFIISVT